MRKNVVFILCMVLACIFLSSCATTSNLSVANSASLTQANFHKVGNITRSYTATYILGFGGSVKASRLKSAITSMTNECGPNQALAYVNVVESTKVPIIPIIVTQTTTVSAVVIEFEK